MCYVRQFHYLNVFDMWISSDAADTPESDKPEAKAVPMMTFEIKINSLILVSMK